MKVQAIRMVSLATVAAAALAGALIADSARAQLPNQSGQTLLNVFPPAPRELKLRLSHASKALEEQRFSDAVAQLGSLLVTPEAEDYFIGPLNEEGTQTSLKVEAQRLLGSMPKQGRESYEIQFGADARSELDAAIADGDVRKLTEVTRKYFHTSAGYEATMLLGRYQLDMGRPLAGALCFKRLIDTPHASALFDPELSILLSTCWLYANMPDKAQETLVALKSRQPQAKLRVGDREVKLFDDPNQALVWIEGLIGAHQPFQSVEAAQWVMFRGNATRNSRSAGSMPLASSPRWVVPVVNEPTNEKQVTQLAKKYLDRDLAALPGVHPLAVANTVLMRTPNGMIAVNFENGKRIWEFPWDMDVEQMSRAPTNMAGAGGFSPRESELNQRLWEDATYGQISSNGESVFVIDDLGFAMPNLYPGQIMIGAGGIQRVNPGWPKSFNSLVAVDLKTEGKLRWKVGGQDGGDEPKLAGMFFLGAPLPLFGQLYVLAEINSEVRLVVLDANTGRQQWSQQLAHLDTRSILYDSGRRLAGATPSFADGVLVCPTSAGAIVAVDLATRSLLWGYQYQQSAPNSRALMFRGYGNQGQREVGSRWADATATIAEGRVLITPVESDKMHCLDLLTGKSVWPAPVDRGEMLYVGCVHAGHAIMVGRRAVTSLNLADGRAAWSKPADLGGMVSGRGFYSDRHYFVPTTAAELLKIDVETGKIAEQIPTGRVLGNLICYQDQIISQSVNDLLAFYQTEPLRARVAADLAKNPDDGDALARQGELLLYDGKQAAALAALRRAYQLKPGDDAIKTLLVQTLMDAMKNDFAGSQAIAAELESLIDQPAQRVEYLRRLAVGLQKNGEIERAFELFLKLAEVNNPAIFSASRPDMEQVDRNLSARRDRWVQASLAELLAAANSQQRANMDAAVALRLDTALAEGSSQSVRDFIQSFGLHPLADRARMLLAAKLIDANDFLEAELLLVRLAESDVAAVAAPASAQLARLLDAAGRPKEAAAQYQLLADRYGEVDCGDGKTGQQLLATIADDSEIGRILKSPVRWDSGKAEVSEGSERVQAFPSYQKMHPVNIRDSRGPQPPGLTVVFDQQPNDIVIRDGQGQEMLRVSMNRQDVARIYSNNYAMLHGRVHGHLLLLSMGYELLAIDMLATKGSSEAILWRHDLSQAIAVAPGVPARRPAVQPKPYNNPWGDIGYQASDADGRVIGTTGPISENGIYYQKMRQLVCVDPLTGETIWARDDVEPNSEIFGDDEFLFVVAPGSEDALVLSAIDGHLVAHRKVANQTQRWTTYGRRVLSVKPHGDNLAATLTDAWTGTEMWSGAFARGAKGYLVEQDEAAVMTPGGKFVLLSLSEGKAKVDTTLAVEDNLSAIHVLRSSDQYILAASRPSEQLPNNMAISPAPGGFHSPLIHGRVYAFDRQTGKAQWQTPAFVEPFGLPLDQPPEIPVLTFMRQMTPTAGTPRRTHTSVLCIDKRDGRILFSKDDIPATTAAYGILGQPENQIVYLQLPGKTYTIKFSDDPTPPEPPAQTGVESSLHARAHTIPGGDVLESMFNALGRSTEEAGLPQIFRQPLRDPFLPAQPAQDPDDHDVKIELQLNPGR
jgi:outer membrane protein assembly factor BamB